MISKAWLSSMTGSTQFFGRSQIGKGGGKVNFRKRPRGTADRGGLVQNTALSGAE